MAFNFSPELQELHAQRCARIDAELATIADPEKRFTVSRLKGIGGSDAAKIMRHSRFGTRHDVWLDKLELSNKTVSESTQCRFDFGHADEEVIAKFYARKTGQKVVQARSVVMPECPWFIANFDRLVCDDALHPIGGLECKTTDNNVKIQINNGVETITRRTWGHGNEYDGTRLVSEDNEINPEYYDQVQFYLMVSRLPWWDVAVAIGRGDIRIFRVYPDTDYQQIMKEELSRFWLENVLQHIEPPLDYADAAVTEATDEIIQSTPEMIKLAAQYDELRAHIKSLEDEQTEIKNKLTQMIGSAGKATYTDETGKVKTLLTFKSSTRLTFDSAAFKADNPELYQKYMRDVTTARTMRINY